MEDDPITRRTSGQGSSSQLENRINNGLSMNANEIEEIINIASPDPSNVDDKAAKLADQHQNIASTND